LIKTGQITVYTGIEAFTEQVVIFDDGKVARFDAVILATGYCPRVSAFLADRSPRICDEHGMPLSSGYETIIPALYFCGYYVAGTGMLREVAIEARRISKIIAGKTLNNKFL